MKARQEMARRSARWRQVVLAVSWWLGASIIGKMSPSARLRWSSNQALAQARADSVANYPEEPNECAPALDTVVRTIGCPKYPGRAVSAEQLSTDRSVEVVWPRDAKRREGRRRPAEPTLKRKLARSGSAVRLSGNLMAYIAGLSWLPGTAGSAALKPAFECRTLIVTIGVLRWTGARGGAYALG